MRTAGGHKEATEKINCTLSVIVMEPITGIASITLQSATIAPAGPPHTYFGVAQSMMSGVKVLATASPPPALALALVAAHCLECVLKAYLSRDGSDAALRKPNVRHDLNTLWAMAFAQGLEVQESPSSWVDCLSGLHKRPYYLRYSTGVHGIVSPGAEPMTSELAALLEIVREKLR
jgi:hypothetical protein